MKSLRIPPYFRFILALFIGAFSIQSLAVIKDIKSLLLKIEGNKSLSPLEIAEVEKAITEAKNKCSLSKKTYDDHLIAFTEQQLKDIRTKESLASSISATLITLTEANQELATIQVKLQEKDVKFASLINDEKELIKALKKSKDDHQRAKDKKKTQECQKEITDLEKKLDAFKKNKAKVEAEQLKLKDEFKNQNGFIVATEKKIDQLNKECTALDTQLSKPDAQGTRLKAVYDADTAKQSKLEKSLEKAKKNIELALIKKREQEEKALKEAAAKAKAKAELDAKKKALEDQARLEAEAAAKAEHEAKKKAKDEKARKAKQKRKERRREKKARKKAAAKAKLLKLKMLQQGPTAVMPLAPAVDVAKDDDELLSLESDDSEDTDESEDEDTDCTEDTQESQQSSLPSATSAPIPAPQSEPLKVIDSAPLQPQAKDDDDDHDDKKSEKTITPATDQRFLTPTKKESEPTLDSSATPSGSAPVPPPMPGIGFCTPRAPKFKVVKRQQTAQTSSVTSPKLGWKDALIAQQKKRGIYVEQHVELPSTAKKAAVPATTSTTSESLVSVSDDAPIAAAPPPPPPPMPVDGVIRLKQSYKSQRKTDAPATPRTAQKPVQLRVSPGTIQTMRKNLGKKKAQKVTEIEDQKQQELALTPVSTEVALLEISPVKSTQKENISPLFDSVDDDDNGIHIKDNSLATVQDDETIAIAKLAAMAKAEEEFEERLKRLPQRETDENLRLSLNIRRTSFVFSDDGSDDTGRKSFNDSFFGSSSHVDTLDKPSTLSPLERIEKEITEKTEQSDALIIGYIKKETESLSIIRSKLAPFFNLDLSSFHTFEALLKAEIVKGKDLNLSPTVTMSDVISGWEHFRKVTTAKQSYQRSEAMKKAKDCAYKFVKVPNHDPVLNCLLPWGRKLLLALDTNLLTENLVRECQNIRKELTSSLTKAKTLIKEIHELKDSTSKIQNRLAELMCWKEQLENGEKLSDDAMRSLGFSLMTTTSIFDLIKEKMPKSD